MTQQLQPKDFLKEAREESMQQQARNILSSYSHAHDVLAEALQNAIDSIEMRYGVEGNSVVTKVEIVFNVPERSITVTDTGTGMPWTVLQDAPCPNITFKSNAKDLSARRSRGEKGVGLSFLTFVCNHLRVKTCDGTETIEAVIDGASDWVHGLSNKRPVLVPVSSQAGPVTEELGSRKYTQIEIADIRNEDYCGEDIFAFPLAQVIYLLRTRTAVGHTDPVILDRPPVPDVEVLLRYVGNDGQEAQCKVPYRYLSPEEYLATGSKISYEQFLDLLKTEKLHFARGKALIYRADHTTAGGRVIRCYGFAMAPRAFDDLTRDGELKDRWAPDRWTGIFLATRGMPTGIEVDHPVTYSAGYWQRVFMLLQDDQMNFDVGRKSLQGQAKPMIQGIAKVVWDNIAPYLQKLTPADPESVERDSERRRAEFFTEAEAWPNLDFPKVQYLKEPQREQMVVALFYELVGAGILRGYKTLRNNTVDQYDAYVRYKLDKREIGALEAAAVRGQTIDQQIIIEFKLDASSLIKDLVSNSKRYRDINLLVCWQLDAPTLEAATISVVEMSPDSVYYFGTTHTLYFPGIYQGAERLAVIELKTFLAHLKSKGQ